MGRTGAAYGRPAVRARRLLWRCWYRPPAGSRQPPGRARLETRPVPTGSPATKTIGITVVACFAARTGGVPEVTMTSTLRRTNSAAISAKRSRRPSAQRYSIATLRPSIHPSSRSRWTRASAQALCNEAVAEPRNPMVGSFPACCPRAASGQATAAPPNAASNSRRPKHRTRKCLPSLGASQLTRRFI